jgi:hypothetical protein
VILNWSHPNGQFPSRWCCRCHIPTCSGAVHCKVQ